MSRTNKIAPLVVALVAMLAFGGVAASAANKKVVKSTISIKFRGGGSSDYAEPASFYGKVKAKTKSKDLKKRCAKDRRVRIIHKRDGEIIRKAKTDGKGKYGVGAGKDFVPGDRYLAEVKKKTLKKGKKTRVVCKGAASKVITAG